MTPDSHPTTPVPRPARVGGVAHLFAALGYSIGGLRRLWQETAFRHEVAGAAIGVLLLALSGAGAADHLLFAMLFCLLVAFEAVNTAVEEIVDHLSPDWALFARHAKDLGSLAVLCVLLAQGLFLVATLWRNLGAISLF